MGPVGGTGGTRVWGVWVPGRRALVAGLGRAPVVQRRVRKTNRGAQGAFLHCRKAGLGRINSFIFENFEFNINYLHTSTESDICIVIVYLYIYNRYPLRNAQRATAADAAATAQTARTYI